MPRRVCRPCRAYRWSGTGLALLAAVLALVPVADVPASEPQAVALLIGNSRYERSPVPSADRNVDPLDGILRQSGFRTSIARELTLDGLRKRLSGFARETPTTSTALVYYTGEVLAGDWKDRQGKTRAATFLRPLNADIRKRSDVRSRCLALPEVVRILAEESGSKAFLVIVDGIVREPFAGRNAVAIVPDDLPQESLVAIVVRGMKQTAASRLTLVSALSKRPQLSLDLSDAVKASLQSVANSSDEKPVVRSTMSRMLVIPETATRQSSKDAIVNGGVATQIVNSIGQVFCWCPPGHFRMGSPSEEEHRSYDEDAVDVTISQGFWMSRYEVTEREYRLATKRSPRVPRGKNVPMTDMRSGDAKRFADNLTKLEQASGRLPSGWIYAVPTEAEWEYACRAGSTTAFSFGDEIAKLPSFGNFADRNLLMLDDSDFRYANRLLDDGHARTAPVGTYAENAWGLCDMHGNVWEWCADAYQETLAGGVDPAGPQKGTDRGRVIRGGSWLSHAHYCRSAMRQAHHDLNSAPYIGIRIVLKRRPAK